jgi:hypothetical protein
MSYIQFDDYLVTRAWISLFLFFSVYTIFTFDEELCPLFSFAIDKNKNNGETETHTWTMYMNLLFIAGRRRTVGRAGVFWQPAKKKRNQAIWDSECRLHNKKVQTPRPHTQKKESGWTTESKIRFRKCKSGQLAPQLRVCLYNTLVSPAAGPILKRWATSNDCGERWEREIAGTYKRKFSGPRLN